MNSLPTVDQVNLQQYWGIVRKLEPEFYMIRIALEETKVNPIVIPQIVRAIQNLSMGTGYGNIKIFMQNKKITQIKPEESIQVNEDAVIDR